VRYTYFDIGLKCLGNDEASVHCDKGQNDTTKKTTTTGRQRDEKGVSGRRRRGINGHEGMVAVARKGWTRCFRKRTGCAAAAAEARHYCTIVAG
jgi:hypothetical protein